MLDHKNFILIEYNNLPYPCGLTAEIKEVAAHFDKENICPEGAYSLHTEYSYGKRKFDTVLINSFPVLSASHKENVPQLWKSSEWAIQFADFIIALSRNHPAPTIVEIHPPFNDYCTLEEFAERFRLFETKVHAVYPEPIIVIENRAGSVYHGGKFLVGKAKEIAALCETIEKFDLKLGIVLDFPQLLTAENIDPSKFNADKYIAAVNTIYPYRHLIKGIHIWGKKKSTTGRWVAHAGNFDTYFGENNTTKAVFLSGIQRICDDGNPRFLVPEVNSGSEDLSAIMNSLFS